MPKPEILKLPKPEALKEFELKVFIRFELLGSSTFQSQNRNSRVSGLLGLLV